MNLGSEVCVSCFLDGHDDWERILPLTGGRLLGNSEHQGILQSLTNKSAPFYSLPPTEVVSSAIRPGEAVPPSSEMSFVKFADFPVEIQDCIWDFVAQQPAIHFFQPFCDPITGYTTAEDGLNRRPKKHSLKLDRRSGYYQRLDLARTCRGARDAVRRYRKRLPEPFHVQDETRTNRELLIDWESDVICLTPVSKKYVLAEDFLRPSYYRPKVRKLALEYPSSLFATPPKERLCPFCDHKDVGKDGDTSLWAEIACRTKPCDLIEDVVWKYNNLEKLYLLVDGLPQAGDPASISQGRLLRYGTTAPPTGQYEVFAARGGVYAEAVSYMTTLEKTYNSGAVVSLRRAARAASEQRRREIGGQANHIFYTLFSELNDDTDSESSDEEAASRTLEEERGEERKEQARSIELRVLAGDSSGGRRL